jgi:hypothetical protein
MKNKLFIQYKKERLTILSPFPLDRPNKVESLKCNSLERAKQIVTSRNHTNIKKALWYDGYGNKTKVEPQKTKL